MAILGRRGGDFIDLVELQKRGLMKKSERKLPSNMKVNSDGSIEFLANSTSSVTPISDSNQFSQTGTNTSSPFGFLDSVSSTSSTNSFGSNMTNNTTGSSDVSSLRIKLDDFDFKFEKLMERIEKIESKLLDFETRR